MNPKNKKIVEARRQADLDEPQELLDAEPQVESTSTSTDRINIELHEGVALAFSDCHYDPEAAGPSTAHRACVRFARNYRPDLLICGGDAVDWAGLSKHPQIMWEARPSAVRELAIAQKRLGEISQASPSSRKLFNFGNHDIRLASFLSQNAPQLEGLHGTRIEDFFPDWEFTWSTWLNPQARIPTVLKHRWHGGVNSARSNVAKGGTHVVTGHTHLLQIVAHTDWSGTKYGVDTGCVADVNSRLFANYTEKGCTGWRSGAAVLTFASGEMMPPELIQVVKESPVPGEGQVFFRGKLWSV